MSARVRVATDEGGAIAVKAARSAPEVTALRYEAELLRRTGHPGLVSIVGHDEAELRLRYAGEPLERWRGDVTQAAGLMAAVAATVGDLHAIGIVHGRLDGTHVLVGSDGRPRLCGFAPPRDRGPADDVAALGRIMGELLDRAVSSDPRWPLLWRRGAVADRRALADVLRRSTDPVAARRPSARALAASLLAAVPGAELPAPSGRARQLSAGDSTRRLPEGQHGDLTEATEVAHQDDPAERSLRPDDVPEPSRPGDHVPDPTTQVEPAYARWRTDAAELRSRAYDAPTDADGPSYGPPEPDGPRCGPAEPGDGSHDDDPAGHRHGAGWPEPGDEGYGGEPTEAIVVGDEEHPTGPPGGGRDDATEHRRFEAEVPIRTSRWDPETSDVRCVDPLFGDQMAARLDDMFADRPWPSPRGAERVRRRAERRPSERRPAERQLVSRPTQRRRPARAQRSLRGVTATVVLVGVGVVVAGAVLLYAGRPVSPPRQALAASACGAVRATASGDGPTDLIVDIDGDGCDDEVQISAGVVQVGGQRWQVGGADDSVAVADWDCDGSATPAIYRPATGEVFVFPRWAGSDGPLTVEPAGMVAGGDRLATASPGADGTCPALAVEMPTGEQRAVEVTR